MLDSIHVPNPGKPELKIESAWGGQVFIVFAVIQKDQVEGMPSSLSPSLGPSRQGREVRCRLLGICRYPRMFFLGHGFKGLARINKKLFPVSEAKPYHYLCLTVFIRVLIYPGP